MKLRSAGLWISWVLCISWASSGSSAQQPATLPKPTELSFHDQFDRKADLADLRGAVVILVYGDRKANELCKTVGESLHVCWHPTAKGQPPAKAQTAPVVAARQPEAGPGVAERGGGAGRVLREGAGGDPGADPHAVREGVPDAVVWLDFGDTLKGMFGQTAGEPNLVVFDAEGRMRMKLNGTPDQAAMDRLAKTVQELRVRSGAIVR